SAQIARNADRARDRFARDVDEPLRIRSFDVEARGADLLTKSSEVTDLELGLRENLAEPGLGEARARGCAARGTHERGPCVEIELRHRAVDAEPALRARDRQRASERERGRFELEAVVARHHRQHEAPRRADVALDVDPARVKRELELEARRLAGR